MITSKEVKIKFPIGASFNRDLDTIVYFKLMKFIKSLSCFTINQKCKDCLEKKDCRYYKITGENFSGYPSFIIEMDKFSSRQLKSAEEHIFKFFLIGNARIYSDFISLFFEQRNILSGFPYQLISIEDKELESRLFPTREFTVQTLMESKDFICNYNKMTTYYNENYDTDFKLLQTDQCSNNLLFIKEPVLFTGTKKVQPKGFIGSMKFEDPLLLDSSLMEIGIGKWNYLGGGKIES